ncbi:hypothetical protein Tsubulata_020276 [Turnera subulata]|uniref:Uncharacterized protein n=1 Tax=Turnera subulata TaxID=218843 RepID=A0A9Q0J5P1_9ROSI|nr:hypothetical protein Tsubulata_020276 [Turnera subulata]
MSVLLGVNSVAVPGASNGVAARVWWLRSVVLLPILRQKQVKQFHSLLATRHRRSVSDAALESMRKIISSGKEGVGFFINSMKAER